MRSLTIDVNVSLFISKVEIHSQHRFRLAPMYFNETILDEVSEELIRTFPRRSSGTVAYTDCTRNDCKTYI